MFNKQLPHMLCAKCHAKVARDAYYCKSCGEVIDDQVAPGLKVEDARISSRIKFALQRHLVRNLIWTVILILFIATGIKMGSHYLKAVVDNGSSKTFQVTVQTPQNPLRCVGTVCHVLMNIRNKTGQVQHISAIPYLVLANGSAHPPANPALMGNGASYCEQAVNVDLRPHQYLQYLGVCSQDLPHGSRVTLVELRTPSGQFVVSGVVNAVVP